MDTRVGPTDLGRHPSAQLLAEQQRMIQRMLHLPRLAELASTTRVGSTPRDVVLEQRHFKLFRYRRSTPASYAEPVLFCYALINRPYILDLLPDKSIVARYLEQGFDVYMIDWAIPADVDHVLTIEDYVCRFVADAVTHIVAHHGRQDLHLLGYCMGGTLTALFSALNPERIRSLTLLAAPIDFGSRDSLLNLWTDATLFDVDEFIDSSRQLPGLVSASLLHVHEAGPESAGEKYRVLRADGRIARDLQLLRHGTLDQRQRSDRRRNLPGVRQAVLPGQ